MRHATPAALTLAFGIAMTAGGAWAQGAPHLSVQDAWSRPTIGASHMGVVYLRITDHGAPDRLVGASTPVAGEASLHQTLEQNGVSRMRPVSSLPVSPGHPLVLQPGADHLMLTQMKRTLKPGDSFPLTLRFAHAGKVTTTVTVRPLGAGGGGMGGMAMHRMGH